MDKKEEGSLRKLIDIPRSLLRELKLQAIDADKSLKNYLEGVIIDHAKRGLRKKQR